MITMIVMINERTVATESAWEAAFETIFGLPLPRYCATITVPPMATAIKILTIKKFNESTMLTALIAVTPAELIIAVFINCIATKNA